MQISSPTFRILESVMRNGESDGDIYVGWPKPK